ncbi:MAG: hypothetical protein HQM14_05965 [SAR324 cluster bacterium]|nr:hypothetical protein [SAR324 cluster bacterium]
MRVLIIGITAVMIFSNVYAFSPEAETGKLFYPSCQVCHDPDQIPPLGPPMYGIQRQYKKAYLTKEKVIEHIVAYVNHPQEEKALMKNAVSALGVMPPLPLPEEVLNNIGSYIYEETFEPPCTHWEYAVKKAKMEGGSDHAKNDRQNYDKFCLKKQ